MKERMHIWFAVSGKLCLFFGSIVVNSRLGM